ncbi:MAG: electron transfer flavoprotein subunit alpha/FixB family protein [Acidimicrobiia bacterium]
MILVLLTHDRGVIDETAMQSLTAARGMEDEIQVVTVGVEVTGLGDQGVTAHHIIRHPDLDDYSPSAWGVALAQLAETLSPTAIVAMGSEKGNEVMAHVGAATGLPMVANCVSVDVTENPWKLTRTRWGGSLLEETTLDSPMKLITFTEHVFEAGAAISSTTVSVSDFVPALKTTDLVTKVVDRVLTADGVTLATSPVVVSGGRGVGSPEGFAPLEELAGLLGGVVGCSRVVTNNGWRPHSDQVGQTGTVIAPDVYIACGISGAIQHWVGMMASKTIIAINTDAEAPMVTKADYAVIGDLAEIVPAIVEEVRARTGR